MGCGATKTRAGDSGDAARERCASPSKGGLRKSKTAWEDDHCCPAEELGKAFTIQQAFPAIDFLGNRHSGDGAPEELSCSSCFRHLLNERQELEFYACRRCWSEGRVYALCSTCHSAMEMRVASEKLTPLSAAKQRRRSSTMTNLSTPSSPQRGKRRGSGDRSMPEMQRSNSMRSDTTAGTEAIEAQEEPGKPMPMPLEQRRRRSSGRSSPSRRKRRSSAPEASPKNANPFRRKSDGDAAGHSAGLLPNESLAERVSGVWVGTIEEGAKTSRSESRQLKFLQSGGIVGSHENGNLSGNLEMPNVQWMEEYPWGTMHVTGRLVLKDMKITGTFQASDGGKGKISLELENFSDLD